MNEIHLVLKDELDGSVTMRFKVFGKSSNVNLLRDTKAKRACKFIASIIDNIPKSVMNDMLNGAHVIMDVSFTVKPRGGIEH